VDGFDEDEAQGEGDDGSKAAFGLRIEKTTAYSCGIVSASWAAGVNGRDTP
jgi:hypothetical protein